VSTSKGHHASPLTCDFKLVEAQCICRNVTAAAVTTKYVGDITCTPLTGGSSSFRLRSSTSLLEPGRLVDRRPLTRRTGHRRPGHRRGVPRLPCRRLHTQQQDPQDPRLEDTRRGPERTPT